MIVAEAELPFCKIKLFFHLGDLIAKRCDSDIVVVMLFLINDWTCDAVKPYAKIYDQADADDECCEW